MLAGSDLLHHKQRKTYETEAIAEVFEDDTCTDQPKTFGLINR